MPLELTLLEENVLSPAVRRAVSSSAPPAVRMMTARGMAPLPPADLVVALYQLAHGEDGSVADVARSTARELPDAVLAPALPMPHDPRVLDFLARALASRLKPLSAVLGNAATADETFASLAALGGEALVEQLALNEQRLLRHPAIITALYLNPRTRMSTAMRAVELAVRNGIHVDGIPGFEDVKAAIERDGAPAESADVAFQAALALEAEAAQVSAAPSEAVGGAQDHWAQPLPDEVAEQIAAAAEAYAEAAAETPAGETKPEVSQNIGQLPMAAKLRLAAVGGAFARSHLVRDSNKIVALAAVRSPALTEQEAERYSGNRALYEEVIRYLAQNRGFTKRYPVKLNLVNNPKCPLSLAIGFLGHLTARDLKQIARSKSVPSALTQAAQNLLGKRETR